ncbi:unnamed protein product [Phyllotreta striolata]|uniref:Cilia- and flagella-associated protein 206 n=1 Tax=Phyllotreta striolata TaxID=444603 RepID=A0A9N9TS01_PHYSR|nr:unnamed protein product [Phyllotreta striolata]
MPSRIEKNIAKEILRECQPRNINPNLEFVLYMLRLLMLDPNWNISENMLNSRANVQKLVKHVISELEAKDLVRIMTLKMQFYYIWTSQNIDQIVHNNRQTLDNRLKPLEAKILVSNTDSAERIVKLRKVIVIYCAFKCGMGSPQQPTVYSETEAALGSIMNNKELRDFSFLPKPAKKEHLTEITGIITGIRLFNKYSNKGGAEIPNLSELFKSAWGTAKTDIQITLSSIQDNINKRMTVVSKCLILKRKSEHDAAYAYQFVPTVEITDSLDMIKDELIHFRQYQLLMTKAMLILDSLNETVDEIMNDTAALSKKIQDIVAERLAVPVYIIFPLFEQLAEYWTSLQNQILKLGKYCTFLVNVKVYIKTIKFNSFIMEEQEKDPEEFEPYKENLDLVFDSNNPHVEILLPDDFDDFDKIEFEYLGFCCWRLVKTEGVLVHGNPYIGVAKYKGKYYVFSSYEAGKEFCEDPDDHLRRVLHLARIKTQLIDFLQLKEQLQAVVDVKTLIVDESKIIHVRNIDVQTDEGYVIPPYKDRSISWNVWDIKRNALKTASQLICKTTSTQTIKSHSYAPIRIQTIVWKDATTQTRLEKYTNVPTVSAFIYGLRGRKDNQQYVMNITRPIDQ